MIRGHNPRNEVGFAICETASGELKSGPVVEGGPASVSIPVACPAGSHAVALFHTHPGGVARPSNQDIRAAQQAGLQKQCIQSDTRLACFRIRPSHRR